MNELRIQIVNYKTKRYLLECLASAIADIGNGLTYDITILDNDSGDDLSDIPSLFPKTSIKIFTNKKNVGFGAGHNLLAKNAGAQYLLILNPDIKFFEKGTVEKMLRRLQDARAQVIGPRLVTPEGKTQHWDHGEIKGLRARVALAMGKSFWKERKKALEVAWVSGAVFLVEKDWFDRLDGFDENFFLYKEEEDLCWRLRAAGGKVIYDPTVSVFHEGSVVAQKSEHFKKSSQYFFNKHIRKKL